jgi:hypothetical protein
VVDVVVGADTVAAAAAAAAARAEVCVPSPFKVVVQVVHGDLTRHTRQIYVYPPGSPVLCAYEVHWRSCVPATGVFGPHQLAVP